MTDNSWIIHVRNNDSEWLPWYDGKTGHMAPRSLDACVEKLLCHHRDYATLEKRKSFLIRNPESYRFYNTETHETVPVEILGL